MLLRVYVSDGEITVEHLLAGFAAVYYKPANEPQLILRRRTETDDCELTPGFQGLPTPKDGRSAGAPVMGRGFGCCGSERTQGSIRTFDLGCRNYRASGLARVLLPLRQEGEGRIELLFRRLCALEPYLRRASSAASSWRSASAAQGRGPSIDSPAVTSISADFLRIASMTGRRMKAIALIPSHIPAHSFNYMHCVFQGAWNSPWPAAWGHGTLD